MKIQAFFLASAALGLAFATTNGCVVTTDDAGSGGSGGAGQTASTTGAGVGGAAGVGGGGGGGACITCADFLTNGGDSTQLCGYSESGCEADSSCEKALAISACTCDAMMGCEAECPVTCQTDPNGDDSKCQECVTMKCSAELTACSNDA